MAKRLSAEEIEILNSNPYVKSAHKTMLRFTADFKQKYLHRYNAGEMPVDILLSMGINPEIIGVSRVWSLAGMFRNEMDVHGGFSDKRRKSDSDIENATMEQLRIEVAYVKQEVEFLKKNIILDMEAQQKGFQRAARTQSLS